MDMMANGMYADIPTLQRAAVEVANTLGIIASPNKAIVGTGSSPNGDLLNGLLQGMSAMNGMGGGESEKEIVLEIDGQTFARLMMPKLSKEYKRNGVVVREDKITGNTEVELVVAPRVADITSVRITIEKWSHPNAVAKLLRFFERMYETYEGNALEMFEVSEELCSFYKRQ